VWIVRIPRPWNRNPKRGEPVPGWRYARTAPSLQEEYRTYKRILVPLENSRYNKVMLEHVGKLAKFSNASLV
jgi:hypothetical protein